MVDTGVEQGKSKGISRNGQDGQDKNFAPKQNGRDCPMTIKPF